MNTRPLSRARPFGLGFRARAALCRCACSALVALLVAAGASAQPRGLESRDLYRLRAVREVQLSPDGARVAYTVELHDRPGRPYQRAWVMDVATGAVAPLGSEGAPITHPRWSPDGRSLAGLAWSETGLGLVVVRPDGSALTRLAGVAGTNHPIPSTGETLAWSPDARRLAFVSATPGPEPEPTTDPVVVTRYLYKPTASEGSTRFGDNRRLHVFVVDIATRRARQLTTGDGYEHSIAWSPLGDEIAFVSNREPDPDRVFNNDVFAVRIADGAVRRLTQTRGAEYAPAWSPDGRWIAYLATKRPLTSSETTMEDTHVWIMDADGAHPREVGAVVDDRQGEPRWSPDGAFVYSCVEERGSVRLYRFPSGGGAAEPVVPPPGQSGSVRTWSAAVGGVLAYALATPDGPAGLYFRTAAGARPLTALNKELLAERVLAPVEAFTFRSFDGAEIEAFLTKPLGMTASSRHPLIVVMHGGPHAQQGPAFDAKAQVYAAQGWATLMVNYRGSTGYGQKLADLIFGDQDGGEARDVLAGIDAALARQPWIDEGRLGIEGVSYGGQLTSWILMQTDRFRAAIPTAGISNLVSFNYTAYYHDYLAVEFGAYPHEGRLMDVLWERSPLRYVANARTPTLILHGENDNDVPIAEAEQLYIALKDVGVETVLVRYPREGHGLRETAHVVDAIDRSIAWYGRHFKKESAVRAPSNRDTVRARR